LTKKFATNTKRRAKKSVGLLGETAIAGLGTVAATSLGALGTVAAAPIGLYKKIKTKPKQVEVPPTLGKENQIVEKVN
jgi:hypothetical protein